MLKFPNKDYYLIPKKKIPLAVSICMRLINFRRMGVNTLGIV